MTLKSLVLKHREEILRLAKKNGVSNVRLFGSVTKGTDSASSDIDMLVHPEPGTGIWELGGLHTELEKLLKCKVDLVPDNAEIFYPSILKEAIPL